MKVVVPRETANAPQIRSFLKLHWFFYLLVVLFALPQMEAIAINYPPKGKSISKQMRLRDGAVSIRLGSLLSDPNGDVLTCTARSSNPYVVTVSLSNTAGATLTPKAVGTATVGVTGTDPEGLSATASISVTVYDNRAPTGSLSAVTLSPGSKKTVDLSSSFSDADGDTLTFTASSSHTMYATASVSGSTLTVTGVAYGSSDISVTANDGTTSTTVKFLASVGGNAPTGSLSAVTLTVAGGAQTVNLSSSFSDPDGGLLSFTASSSNTACATVSVSGSVGSYTLTITPVAAGSSTISVTADNGREGTTTVSFTATVNNSAPTGSLSDVRFHQGDSARTVNLSSSFSDADEDDLTYSASSSNTSCVTVGVSSSTLTVTPVSIGSSTITVTANDGTVSINTTFKTTVAALDSGEHERLDHKDIITPPNRAPTGSLSAVTLTVAGGAQTINLSAHISDPDEDPLYFSASSSNTNYVTVGVSGSTLELSPVAAGSSTISVTAYDGTTSTNVSFTVTVESEPENNPPSVVDATNPTPQPNSPPRSGTAVDPIVLFVENSESVLVQFSDPDGDALSYSVAGGNSAASASMSGNTVTITALTEGKATLTVTATDTRGATATQTISVTVVAPQAAVPNTPGGPDSLLKVSGDNQSAQINTALADPLVVEVRNAQDRVVEGVAVQFNLDQTGATLDATSITNAAGQAYTTITFGDSPGEIAVEVSAAGVDETVVFTATATPLFPEPTYIDVLEVLAILGDTRTPRVFGVAFSPDGAMLASAQDDNTVRLWAVESRELKQTLIGHQSAVRSVAFSPDGNTLASGGMDSRVLLWEPDTGRLKQIIKPGGTVWGIDFSPDGNTLAIATDHGFVSIWDVSNLRRIERKHRISAHSVRAWSVAFNPDGDLLASSGGDAIVRLWNPETGEITKELPGHEEQVLSVAFGGDNMLASAGADGSVRLWDLETESGRVLTGHTGWVFSTAFHPNGEMLASTGKDISVRLWEAAAGTPLHVLERHTGWGRSIAVSRDGILASGGYDNMIHLWDLGVKLDDMEDTEDIEETEENAGGENTAAQQSAELLPNFPNPFNPETWIPYHLSNNADVQISIYDSKGELVRWLDLGHQAAGNYTDRTKAAYWDGRNEFGEHVASGLYFYRLTTGDYSATRKMLILK